MKTLSSRYAPLGASVLLVFLVAACGGGARATNTPEPTEALNAERVVVTTDKAEYQRGEVVQITVRNNLQTPLWYAQKVECGLPFWLLQSCDGVEISIVEHFCVWAAPQHDFTQLDPGETLAGSWDTQGDGMNLKPAEPGCYRILFPHALTELKFEWEGKRIDAYSDEFTVK
jgi:hypothetical protein